MTIDDAEKELIRVLDTKVAAGAKLEQMRGRSSNVCGCALRVYTDSTGFWYESFGWSGRETMDFALGFDGNFKVDPATSHFTLGNRIAIRYGVRWKL